MKLLGLRCAAALLMVGCSVPRAPDTVEFYKQESVASKICLSELEKMPLEARLRVDPVLGRSPFTTSAWCYASQMQSVVNMMNYPHSDIAMKYADHLVKLSEARDKGMISTEAALESYRQVTGLFKKAISNGDKQIEAAALREVGDRLAIFSLAMSGVYLERDRQRIENRPVTCRLTGVYVMNSVVCDR